MVSPDYGVTDDQRYALAHRCTPFGTILTAVGTVITGVTGKIIKVHQYSISVEGTLNYNFCDAKPGGGTICHGGYASNIISNQPDFFTSTPYVPYPDYIFQTSNAGSAVCLGTWGTTAMAGTVRIQGLYTSTDTS